MRLLDLAAKRYGVRPSSLLKTSLADLAIDLTVALRADNLDFDDRAGDYWHVALIEAFAGAKRPFDPDKVIWF